MQFYHTYLSLDERILVRISSQISVHERRQRQRRKTENRDAANIPPHNIDPSIAGKCTCYQKIMEGRFGSNTCEVLQKLTKIIHRRSNAKKSCGSEENICLSS